MGLHNTNVIRNALSMARCEHTCKERSYFTYEYQDEWIYHMIKTDDLLVYDK